jgi:Protein kinase domain
VSSDFSAQQYAVMARLVPGSQLAGYVIEEQVGAGGMAVVFRARDAVLGRLAALKVLSPALAADVEFRARFLSESRAVASVEEPHIIPVYGAGEVDGVLYIATRFVAGGDLADVLQRAGGRLEPDRAAGLIGQVAAALDAAHAAGLVHRDVKPGNVLVDAGLVNTGLVNTGPGRGEHAFLSDFGLSKRAMAISGLTATGTFLGTPDYSAPEQIRGLPLDGRADQYALACMAFTLLAGDLPFHRPETMATLFAHLNDPVPPLARYRADLPPGTDAVLARALAKEPAGRYPRCGDFAAALRDVLAGAGRPAAPRPAATVLAAPSPGGAEPGPRPSRPAGVPETALWAEPSMPPTEIAAAPAGSAPRATRPLTSWPAASAVPGPPPAGPPAPSRGPAANGAQPTWPGRPVPPGRTGPGQPPTARSWPPERKTPPPAAGQGGKLPLVSKSAVIAALAAAAALLLILLLHGNL